MSFSSVAVGWTIWQRHRRGLCMTTACFVAAALVTALSQNLLPPEAALRVSTCAWGALVIAAFYAAAVFAYGFDADLATAGTCFPTRMFTLPVRTAQLSGWPMLGGAAFLSLLWIGTAGLILRPWGFDVPIVWPALLAAALLVWAQALLWWPFGLPWLRVVAGVLLLHVPATGTMTLGALGYSAATVCAFLAAALVLGAIVAHAGVARSRRGAVASWGWLSAARFATGRETLAEEARFDSAEQAQSWFEWRRTGLTLPLIVAPFLFLALMPIFIEGLDPRSVLFLLTSAVLTPVYIAGLAGGGGKNNSWARDQHGLASFLATRPMTTSQLIAAKLRAAAWTTVVTWALVLVAVGMAAWLSGHHRMLRTLAAGWIDARPTAEVVTTLVVASTLLLLTTWRRQVESRLIGLTGREWPGRLSVFLSLSLFVAGMIFVSWLVSHPQHFGSIIDALPWLMGALVTLKLVAAAAAIRALRSRYLVSDLTFASWATAWLIAFVTLLGLLRWVVPSSAAATYTLALGVILALPLARLATLPLALHWNRHR